MLISTNYRKGEEASLESLRAFFDDDSIRLGNSIQDFGGYDLVSDDSGFRGYVRTRFNGYLDLTFNGVQALVKAQRNARETEKFIAVLQHSPSDGFDDPDFKVEDQVVIDLGQFIADYDYDIEELKKQNRAVVRGPVAHVSDIFQIKTQRETGKTFFVVSLEDLQDYILEVMEF
jgi:hypothetical protein